jgi:Flp pilus assembly protein TadB
MAADFSSVVTKLRTAAETLEQHRSDARQRRRSEADQRERDLAEQRRREAALTKRRDQATAQQASWDAQHKRAVTMATVTAVVLLVAGLALGVLVSPVASVVMVIGAVSWWLVSKFAGPSGPRPVLPET